jgi:hypothetical protein
MFKDTDFKQRNVSTFNIQPLNNKSINDPGQDIGMQIQHAILTYTEDVRPGIEVAQPLRGQVNSNNDHEHSQSIDSGDVDFESMTFCRKPAESTQQPKDSGLQETSTVETSHNLSLTEEKGKDHPFARQNLEIA